LYGSPGSGLAKGWLAGCKVATGRQVLARRTGIGARCKVAPWREITTRGASVGTGRKVTARGELTAWGTLAGKTVVKTAFALIAKAFARAAACVTPLAVRETAAAIATETAFARAGKTTAGAAPMARAGAPPGAS
jgi:hypothetical protein